jgi:hypothetical protein
MSVRMRFRGTWMRRKRRRRKRKWVTRVMAKMQKTPNTARLLGQ